MKHLQQHNLTRHLRMLCILYRNPYFGINKYKHLNTWNTCKLIARCADLQGESIRSKIALLIFLLVLIFVPVLIPCSHFANSTRINRYALGRSNRKRYDHCKSSAILIWGKPHHGVKIVDTVLLHSQRDRRFCSFLFAMAMAVAVAKQGTRTATKRWKPQTQRAGEDDDPITT